MTRPPATADAASWSRYWAAGHEHSCPTSFDGFYGPALQAFWQRQAARVRPDETVLDLGCGNGALLRFLWSQFSADAAPALHGVDAADLRTEWLTGPAAARITVHPRTPFSKLPFAQGAIALAASQFGIEYGNEEATWTELFRVLAGRSRVAFVVHKKGSRLDAVAADEMTLGRAALASDGVLAAALGLVPYLAQAATEEGRAALRSSRQAETARARFNAASDGLMSLAGLVKHGDAAHDILGSLGRILGAGGPGLGAVAQGRLEQLRRGIEDHVARQAALRVAALDAAGLEKLRTRLQQAGFTLAGIETVSEQGFEMGWAIEGTREHG